MKKTFKLITILLILLFSIVLIASAHSGRTDANGGHWDHSTGEYHYHTRTAVKKDYDLINKLKGQVQQEKDALKATSSPINTNAKQTVYGGNSRFKPPMPISTPIKASSGFMNDVNFVYNEVIKGGNNNSTLSKKGNSKSEPIGMGEIWGKVKERYASSVQNDSVKKQQKNSTHKNYVWFFIIGSIALLYSGITIINSVREKLSSKKKEEPQPTELDMSMIPYGVGIDDHMLPYVINRKYGYGKQFNAFITPHSNCYHLSKCPTVKNRKKMVVHRYIAMNRYVPCSLCRPKRMIDDWYIEFVKKNKIESKYNLIGL